MTNERDELMTRWTLIRKVNHADCDDESWAEFYRIYRNLIYSVALKAGLRHEEAEDAVQETMRTVFENIGSFKPDPALGSFRSWLLKTARWRINDLFRKRPRQPIPSGESNRTATAECIPDPASLNWDGIWEEQWRKNLFETAVSRVKGQTSPIQYQIFDLYVLRQQPATRVMQSLGVSMTQVYLARHRVMKLIRKEVKALERKLD